MVNQAWVEQPFPIIRFWDQFYSSWQVVTDIIRGEFTKHGDFQVDTGSLVVAGDHRLASKFVDITKYPLPITLDMNGVRWSGQVTQARRRKTADEDVWELTCTSDEQHFYRVLANNPQVGGINSVLQINPYLVAMSGVKKQLSFYGALFAVLGAMSRRGPNIYYVIDQANKTFLTNNRTVTVRDEDTVGDLVQSIIDLYNAWVNVEIVTPDTAGALPACSIGGGLAAADALNTGALTKLGGGTASLDMELLNGEGRLGQLVNNTSGTVVIHNPQMTKWQRLNSRGLWADAPRQRMGVLPLPVFYPPFGLRYDRVIHDWMYSDTEDDTGIKEFDGIHGYVREVAGEQLNMQLFTYPLFLTENIMSTLPVSDLTWPMPMENRPAPPDGGTVSDVEYDSVEEWMGQPRLLNYNLANPRQAAVFTYAAVPDNYAFRTSPWASMPWNQDALPSVTMQRFASADFGAYLQGLGRYDLYRKNQFTKFGDSLKRAIAAKRVRRVDGSLVSSIDQLFTDIFPGLNTSYLNPVKKSDRDATLWKLNRLGVAWYEYGDWWVASEDEWVAEAKKRLPVDVNPRYWHMFMKWDSLFRVGNHGYFGAVGEGTVFPGLKVAPYPTRDRTGQILLSLQSGNISGYEATYNAPDAVNVVAAVSVDNANSRAYTLESENIDQNVNRQKVEEMAYRDVNATETSYRLLQITDELKRNNPVALAQISPEIDYGDRGVFFYKEKLANLSAQTWSTDLTAQVAQEWAESQGEITFQVAADQLKEYIFGDDYYQNGVMFRGWKIGDKVTLVDGTTAITEVISGYTVSFAAGEETVYTPIFGRKARTSEPVGQLVGLLQETAYEAGKASMRATGN